MKPAHPLSITHLRASALLRIVWDDGLQQDLSETTLRSACRCADCTALRARRAKGETLAGTVQEKASLEQIHPVGHYGIQLVFRDGHARGIYPWSYLRGLESPRSSS